MADTAERLRELILALPPEACIGSLNEIAERLEVGIVTVQQTARILEHEGLLRVKRGPGGGYYGTRPDDAALERAFATYMRIHDISYKEAFELSLMLDCEIIQSVARVYTGEQANSIHGLVTQLEACTNGREVIAFEQAFRETLLTIDSKPLLELLARVAMQLYSAKSEPEVFEQMFGLNEWRQGRLRILQAILNHDPQLAYFEAQRFRTLALGWMQENRQ